MIGGGDPFYLELERFSVDIRS